MFDNIKKKIVMPYINEGDKFMSQGQYDLAINEYNKALNIRPNDDLIYNNLGVAFARLNDNQKARTYYKSSINLNVNEDQYYDNLADVDYDIGNYQEEIWALGQAIKLSPNDDNYYNKLAVAYSELQDNQRARTYYKKAIELNNTLDLYYDNLADVDYDIGDYKEEIWVLGQAIKLSPNDDRYYNKLAIAYTKIQDNQKARTYYKKAISLNDREEIYYSNLADVDYALGNYQEEISDLQQAVKLNQNNDDYYDRIGVAYLELQDNQKAKTYYKKAISLNDKEEAYYYNLASVDYTLGNYQEEISDLQQATKLNPNNDSHYNRLGVVYEELQDYQKAKTYYKKAISLNDKEEVYYYNLANIDYELGNYQDMINALQQAIKLNANNDDYYNGLGIAYLELQDYQKSRTCYKKAISLNSEEDSYYYNLAEVNHKLSDYQEEIKSLQQAIKINSDNADYYDTLGLAFEDINDNKNAITSYKKATKIAPDCKAFLTHLHNCQDNSPNLNDYQKDTDYLQQLNDLIGLDNVKERIKSYINRVRVKKVRTGINSHGEIHLVFEGEPGTGKTTVANLFCNILYQNGIIKTNNYFSINASNLIGKYQGWGAKNVRNAIKKSKDGVLFIDEAYSLAGNEEGAHEVMNTLIPEIENHRDDIVVILAGYTKEMEGFLNNSNPGLSSRFPDRIKFSDYTNQECQQIIQLYLNDNHLLLDSTETKDMLMNYFDQYITLKRNNPNHKFANARTVRTIFNHLNDTFSNRMGQLSDSQLEKLRNTDKIDTITSIDVKNAFNDYNISDTRKPKNNNEALNELKQLIGLSSVKDKIQDYINNAKVNHLIGGKSQSEIHLIFSGNPGTGKTTVARLFAKALYENKIIKTNNLLEVEGSDLIGQYIGHTQAKTRKIINKAIGGVLFIDEAYTLAHDPNGGNNNSFKDEAVTELIAAAENHRNDLAIIISGYTKEMNDLLKYSNPGLKSRFSTKINFPDYSCDECVKIMMLMLKKDNIHLVNDQVYSLLNKYIQKIVLKEKQDSSIFGNARFIRNIEQELIQAKNNRLGNLSNEHLDDLKQNNPNALVNLNRDDINTVFYKLNN